MASKFGPPKYALGIDWETSGSDFNGWSHDSYQGIAFGAIIFDTVTFEEVDHLYCELKFDATRYKWSNEAEAIHGLSREYLDKHGMEREDALAELLSVMIKWMGPSPGKIMFMGHNVDFDIGFTCQLANDFGMEIKQYHVKLDTSSTAFALANVYKSDDVFSIFTGQERDGAHNALEDVRLTLESLKAMREIFKIGLEG